MSSESISIMKGFGILLMVLAHAGCPKVAHDFIYMFHMPLFFIMSGYCLKPQYIDTPKQFVWRRIKGLYFPYVKYGLLFLVLHNVFYYCNIYNSDYGYNGVVSYLYSSTDFAKHAVLIVTSMRGCAQLLGGYWFLRCLFWGSLIGYATIKYIPRSAWGGFFLLSITIVTKAFPILHIPYFGIDSRVFMSATFFIVGHVIRQSQFEMRGSYAVLMCAIVAVDSILMPTNMMGYKTWQVIPYCICAVMGTLMVCYVSSKIAEHNSKTKAVMVYIGNCTLTILTWHFLSFKVVSLLIIYIHHLPIKQLAEFPVIGEFASAYWPVYFIVGSSVPLFVGYMETQCGECASKIRYKS